MQEHCHKDLDLLCLFLHYRMETWAVWQQVAYRYVCGRGGTAELLWDLHAWNYAPLQARTEAMKQVD